MAVYPRARGATGAVPGIQQEGRAQNTAGLLDHQKMSDQTEESVSGLGIQGGKIVLVYQWHHLRWCGS